ncbi:MAG: hypothetical protein ACI8XY_000308, partial [bacterium]
GPMVVAVFIIHCFLCIAILGLDNFKTKKPSRNREGFFYMN